MRGEEEGAAARRNGGGQGAASAIALGETRREGLSELSLRFAGRVDKPVALPKPDVLYSISGFRNVK